MGVIEMRKSIVVVFFFFLLISYDQVQVPLPHTTWLTPESGKDILPAPLYFLSSANSVGNQQCSQQIVRVERDGKTRTYLNSCWTYGGLFGYDISPIDGRIALIAEGKLWVEDPNGENANPVINNLPDPEGSINSYFRMQSPVWSPDGKHIAYADGGIRVVDIVTGEREDVIESWCDDYDFFPAAPMCMYGVWYLAPRWSPNGQALIFHTQTASSYYQMIYDFSEKNEPEELLGRNMFLSEEITWSRDGRTLFLPSQEYVQYDWRREETRTLLDYNNFNAYRNIKYPIVTPAGKILFFETNLQDSGNSYYGKLIEGTLTENGLEIRIIREDVLPKYIDELLWHDSGEFYAFSATYSLEGGYYIAVTEVETGDTYLIAEEPKSQSQLHPIAPRKSVWLLWGNP